MIVEPLRDENEWENFVATSPKGTFFHTLRWKEVLEKSFPYETLYLVIRDSNDNLIGICPFFITKKLWPFRVLDSLPNSDLGGPLMKEEYNKEAASLLKDYLKELSSDKGITYAKIRLSDPKLCECLKTRASKVDTNSGTMILDLTEKPMDFIWNKIFKQKQRKYIKRFEHDGFITKEAKDTEDLNKFYALYHQNAIKRGVPYPFTYYRNVFDLLYPNSFNIILIERGEICIGAGIFFIYPERKVIYMVGAALDKTVSSRYKIYYKLRWETIKYAHRNGFRYLSFGPTPSDPGSVYYSLKSEFGAEFYQDYFLYLPFNGKLFFLRENAIKIGRKMKNRLPKTLVRRVESKL